MKIFVLTDIPSPYQTEIFNELAASDCTLHVGYLRRTDPARQWNHVRINHDSTMLDADRVDLSTVTTLMNGCDLAIFNYYRHPHAEQLLNARASQRQPWCFWGERPGFLKPEWPGRILRQWKLRSLHSSSAPIWGIGQFAIDQYKREFGSSSRMYFNLPYFSNLERFQLDRHSNGKAPTERVFLFSGALTRRKGVDVLARAFCKLVHDMPHVKLRIVGDGPLLQEMQKRVALVQSNVTFLGFKDWDDLPSQYALADVLCVPSRYDGWGLVIPEGLAAGLPVIATDQMGAALEFIKNGENGWLCRAGDHEDLLKAMHRAAHLSTEELAKYSANARDSVCNHTLQNGARRFLQYANEVVANWQV